MSEKAVFFIADGEKRTIMNIDTVKRVYDREPVRWFVDNAKVGEVLYLDGLLVFRMLEVDAVYRLGEPMPAPD